jgi:hypothetical protein
MTIVLPALAVAFAAFCIWLGVRIYNRRERWAKWTFFTATVLLPIVYVASLGPAARIVARNDPDAWAFHPLFDAIYWPIARCATAAGDGSIPDRAIVAYLGLVIPKNSQIFIPDGTIEVLPNGVHGRPGVFAKNDYRGDNEW